MMKHSPKPWEISDFQDADYMIAICNKYQNVAYAVTIDAVDETPEEKANAKLIASAPDLLEACQDAYEILSDIPVSECRRIAQKLKTEIAKATE